MEPGFRREFLAIMASDLMTKYHDGTTKIDADETVGEECHLRHKRTKYQRGSPVTSTAFSPGFLLHPFEEASPLGLMLKKTPSFIELIQVNLSEGDSAAPLAISNSSLEVGRKNESKCALGPAIADRYKASNFPALVLRIGSWERISRYEGDLVVKCYDAKRRLVWEVLEGGLKSKMEIHWSDITSLKTSCPDNEPGTLEIEVSIRYDFHEPDRPFNSFIASRGVIPMYITITQRLPFFENTLDIVHSMHVLSNWIPSQLLEFVLYDIYRILRPGGLFWLDHFFCTKDQLKIYVPMIEQLGYKKLKWSVAPKLDRGPELKEMYISAVLEKPLKRQCAGYL